MLLYCFISLWSIRVHILMFLNPPFSSSRRRMRWYPVVAVKVNSTWQVNTRHGKYIIGGDRTRRLADASFAVFSSLLAGLKGCAAKTSSPEVSAAQMEGERTPAGGSGSGSGAGRVRARGRGCGFVVWLHGLGDCGRANEGIADHFAAAAAFSDARWAFPTAPTTPVTCNRTSLVGAICHSTFPTDTPDLGLRLQISPWHCLLVVCSFVAAGRNSFRVLIIHRWYAHAFVVRHPRRAHYFSKPDDLLIARVTYMHMHSSCTSSLLIYSFKKKTWMDIQSKLHSICRRLFHYCL